MSVDNLSGCEFRLYEYGKSFGLTIEQINNCITKITGDLSLPRDEICAHLLKKLHESSNDCIEKSNIKLKDYQRKAVEHMIYHRGLIISFEVGAGKTLTAVTITNCLLHQAQFFGKDIKVVIITPTSLQDNFKKEMRGYGINPNDKHYSFYTLAGFANAVKKGQVDCENTLLIIDEGHNLRTDYRQAFQEINFGGKEGTRAETFIKCAKKAWKVVILTATPAYNQPHDIVNLVAMATGDDPLTAKEWDTLMADNNKFKQYFSCLFSFYTPSREEYPTRIDKYQYVVMNREVSEKYSKMERSASVRRSKNQPVNTNEESKRDAFMTKIRQATNNIEPCMKCGPMIQLLKEKVKTIVYSEFKTSGIEIIQKLLDNLSIPYVTLTGSTPKNKRSEITEQINSEDPNSPYILFITKAGSEGLDLKRIRRVLFFEKGWNKLLEEQVVGRAIRYRSHADLPPDQRNVTVYHFILVKPFDTVYIRDNIPFPQGYNPSADLYLHIKALAKKKWTDALIARLKEVSIENIDCPDSH